jgi:hypothetical protein
MTYLKKKNLYKLFLEAMRVFGTIREVVTRRWKEMHNEELHLFILLSLY